MKYHPPRASRYLTAFAVLAVLLGAASAQSALLLYEPFNYGGSDAGLTSLSGSALGLAGTSYGGSGTTTYQSAGMGFGDLLVSGGNASLTYNGGAFSTYRGLDFNVATGETIYGSYIFRATGDGGQAGGITGPLFGRTSSVNDNSAPLAVSGNYPAATQTVIGGIKSYANSTGSAVTASGSSLGSNNIGLVLFQVTNIGGANGETQDISLWMLTSDQFANFKSSGLNASALNGAATGTGSTDVLQRASYTLTISSGNNIRFTSSDYLALFAYRAQHDIDELRLSNSNLDEVTPVPEPSAVPLILGIAGFFCILGRRRKYPH